MFSDKVGDRLWIWGHHAEAFWEKKLNGYRKLGGLPARRHIDVLEGRRYLGIKNAALIRPLGELAEVRDRLHSRVVA